MSAARVSHRRRRARGARLATAGLCALAVAVLTGCGSAPRTSFYTLVPPASTAAAAATASGPTPAMAPTSSAIASPAWTLSIGPVSVPEAVDRPQFVVRDGAYRQQVLEQRRWTQPLPREIDAALQAGLAARLPAVRVTVLGQSAAAEAAWRLAIDVQRFDSDLAAGTDVDLVWTLRDRSARLVDSGRFVDRQPVSGADYDALAAAHAGSLARLADQIAARLRDRPPPTAAR